MSNAIRNLPAAAPRVETGPTQFGDDWPGIFVRGDDAASVCMALEEILRGIEGSRPIPAAMEFALMRLRSFQKLLAKCDLTRPLASKDV